MFNGYFFRLGYRRQIHHFIRLHKQFIISTELFQLLCCKAQSRFFPFQLHYFSKRHDSYSFLRITSNAIINTLTSAGETPEMREA